MRRETTLFITCVLALVCMGVLMVYSASAVRGEGTGLLRKQLLFVSVGLVAMLVASRFDYHRFMEPILYRPIVLGAFALLIAVLIPGVGREIYGAQRWIRLGGFQFQPSEFAKFALVLLLAVKLTTNRDEVHTFFHGYVPAMMVAGSFAAMVLLERDLGIPVMMMGTTYVMLCVAGVRWRYLLASIIPLGGAVFALVLYAPHRIRRLTAFINPWEYREDAGWQLIQSLSAFAQGGIWGRGAGAGEQKLGYLPFAQTDFIFAVIGEELGLFGTLAVVAVFMLFLFAAMRIAMHAQDLFGALLASGIAALIAGQAVFIMAVTTGLLPTKGLPLPFISYGGTALMVTLGLSGILVNVGVQAVEPKPKRKFVPAA